MLTNSTTTTNFHKTLIGYMKSNNHGMVALMFDGERDLFRAYCMRHADMAAAIQTTDAFSLNDSFEKYTMLKPSMISKL